MSLGSMEVINEFIIFYICIVITFNYFVNEKQVT